MNFLELKSLTADLLPTVVEFDRLCLGGLWTIDGYRREIESPNSELIVLQPVSHPHLSHEPEPHSQPHSNCHGMSAQPRVSQGDRPPQEPILGLGCLWMIADEAHITLLAVHPNYRQQGFGQLLLHRLLTAARHHNLRWATLEVRVSNQAAISLYQKFGFEVVGQRKRYYQDTGEDALILWVKGLQHSSYADMLHQWYQQIDKRLHQSHWALKQIMTGIK